ncbi:MAG: polysaccharide biosynthesis/export family protein [Candidatus Omnitrophota bacterium]
MKKRTVFLLIILIFLSYCVMSDSNVWTQTAEYRLQPTDLLSITIHNHPDLNTKTRISNDGNITFPLVGQIAAAGSTINELEEQLRFLLEKDYLHSAQVLVFIEVYHPRQVSVIGEVNKPGKYDMPDEKSMTLLEAIAMAEGFTKDALLAKVKIMRTMGGNRQTIIVNVKDITGKDADDNDILLEPDDVVVVPESFFLIAKVNIIGRYAKSIMVLLKNIELQNPILKFQISTNN